MDWYKRLARLKAVTITDVNRVAKLYFRPENRVVVTLDPTLDSAKTNGRP